ncbi:hypothetical protein PACILC2_18380 [Paenibacillus cisolokensis]|uniref:CopC domain-containing protein n=1 Tax=Paenibacillus cisolokensis TaxID=1658519 RepID=A0ABQ4N4Y4_9BACL|nr:copper resistance protein CopC [Paenibacillus cisolokensis]GIQ63270.1 hypothetical protein PACILC2_18380 [Paenibacillus cisolokensis]
MMLLRMRKRKIQKYRLLLAVLIACAVLPRTAWGHSALVESSPEANSVVKQPPTEITLTFNTKIEPVSAIVVKREDKTSVALAETKVDGKRIVASLEEPLENGRYTVDWSIIGEDGHAIDGAFAFEVQVPDEAETPAGQQTEERTDMSGDSAAGAENNPAAGGGEQPAAADDTADSSEGGSETGAAAEDPSATDEQNAAPLPEKDDSGRGTARFNMLWLAGGVAVIVLVLAGLSSVRRGKP